MICNGFWLWFRNRLNEILVTWPFARQIILKHLSDEFLHIIYSRGVLQALIKKQFPAPDGRKVAELFGIDSDTSDRMSGRSSPAPERLTPVKRRKKGSYSSTKCLL